MLATPMWVRDRAAAVLYADTGADDGEWYPEAIHVMASMAALSLEALPARARHPRPARPARPAKASAPGAASAGPQGSERSFAREAPEPQRMEVAAAGAVHASALEDEPAEQDSERQSQVEDARRFARLLVSEIVLYNQKEIEEGRRQGDLYQRLKEDIERSRTMYEERVSRDLSGALAYFREEIVDKLAGGDEGAIDLPWG